MLIEKKSGIFVVKGEEQNDNIEGYPILNEYKYLGILIDKKLNIQNHIGFINKKLSEYFRKNYFLNQRYFSVKSIIYKYFHESRLYYGLPAFIDKQQLLIEFIDLYYIILKCY